MLKWKWEKKLIHCACYLKTCLKIFMQAIRLKNEFISVFFFFLVVPEAAECLLLFVVAFIVKIINFAIIFWFADMYANENYHLHWHCSAFLRQSRPWWFRCRVSGNLFAQRWKLLKVKTKNCQNQKGQIIWRSNLKLIKIKFIYVINPLVSSVLATNYNLNRDSICIVISFSYQKCGAQYM